MPNAVPQPTAAPSDLAWRVIGLTSLYRLFLPPVLLVLQALASPGILAPTEQPEMFRAVCYAYLIAGVVLLVGAPRAAAEPAHPRPGQRDGRHPGPVSDPVRRRGGGQRPGHPAGAAGGRHGIAWRSQGCVPGTRHRDTRSADAADRGHPGRLCADQRLHHRRHAGRGAVRHRPVGVADCRSPASERGAGQAPGNRPRQPRAAVPLHRPASAREHPGGGYRGPDSPDQRDRGGPAGRRAGPPGRALGGGLAAAAVFAGDLAPAHRGA